MVRSIRQLEALRHDWDGLAAGFQSPLLDHDWFMSCAEAFHHDEDLRIVSVRNGASLQAIAPLVSEPTPGGQRLTLLGASRLYEPSGWLFSGVTALDDLARKTIRLGDAVVLQRVPSDSPIVGALGSLPRAVTVARGVSTSLAVVMRSTWDAYYAGLSSHITGNLRRLRRKAEKVLGRVNIEHLTPTPSDVDGLLEEVVKVEGSGWKGRAGSALSARADLRDFFRRYGHRAAERGRLRVTRLSFGSELAAVELSVEAYRRMWQLKIGYNDALSAYYPGLQLTEASIRSAFERGLESYEFLGSAATWEERWSPDVRQYRMLAVYPLNAKGVVTGCRDLAGMMWRRAQTIARKPSARGAA
jgi:CelD/BcsL family acetyltransferase involved in cellulose biosynthesis